MMIERIQEQCKLTLPTFCSRVLPIEWMPRGILTSEGLAFCAMADLFQIDTVLESGIAEGRSTEMWARYAPSIRRIAVDWKLPSNARLQSLIALGTWVINGDARDDLAHLLRESERRTVGVFIDGPKGEPAVKLAVECMSFDCVKFVGVHDLARKLNWAERQVFEAVPVSKWYTDEGWFVDNYGHLDVDGSHWDDAQGTKWEPYWRLDRKDGKISISGRGSYGYTIGFLYKEPPC